MQLNTTNKAVKIINGHLLYFIIDNTNRNQFKLKRTQREIAELVSKN